MPDIPSLSQALGSVNLLYHGDNLDVLRRHVKTNPSI
jgi:hypothetical protein